MTKICKKCNSEKLIIEYYKNTNKCKECTKSDVKANYRKNIENPGYIEKERKRGRDKYYSLYRFTSVAKPVATRKHIEKYPEKREATNRSATLPKPFKGAEKHHWSYNSEHYKDVLWLSKRDHMKAHRFIIYDQDYKKYRKCTDNQLLETREDHVKWIVYCIEVEED